MSDKIVYLDNNSTTKAAPEVVDVMKQYFLCDYGNSESTHAFGSNLQYVEQGARESLARLINGRPKNIYFTSGATESNNWVLRGVMKHSDKRHLVISAVEHPSVLNVAQYLEKEGYRVTYLSVTDQGVVRLEDLMTAATDETALVSVMYANNETGAIMPIREIGEYLRDKSIIFHTDATQAVGKIHVDVKRDNIELLSFSGHKFHGPKGVGGLYFPLKKYVSGKLVRMQIAQFMIGGEQQGFMRAGTMNTPGIAGLGKAADLAYEHLSEHLVAGEDTGVSSKRDDLQEIIEENIPKTMINAKNAPRLPNTLNLTFPGAEGESIIDRLSEKGICVSSGSACTSKSLAIPYVLDAMGINHDIINSTIRFSLSRYNTTEELKYVRQVLPKVIEDLRLISGFKE